MSCKERQKVIYDLEQLSSIQRKRNILIEQITDKSEDGINKIWENQKVCGSEISNAFNDKNIVNILVYGKTQTGKTGCMTSFIQHYVLANNIPINNIYIITGLSDKEWKKDTMNRMPDSINNQVFHRGNLNKKFVSEIKNKKNILIIMDEIQIACETEQTIYKSFQSCGLFDLETLLKNDVKIVQFSATPDGHINDIDDWEEHSVKIKLEPGIRYTGTKQLKEQNRLKQFKDLTKIENVRELATVINSFKPITYIKDGVEETCKHRYHTIRIPNSRKNNDRLVIDNFKKVFGNNYNYNETFLESKKGDINETLKRPPNKDTFIFIKEILRCAKTKVKLFIGIEYERWTTVSDSSIIQGSVGRLTGYDDNGDSVCYTNLSTIDNYETLWENNFDFKRGNVWNTKTTKFNEQNNITTGTGTYNAVKNIKGLEDNSTLETKEIKEPCIMKTKTFEDASKFIKNHIGAIRGPNQLKTISGFYHSNIRGVKRVYSTDEVYKERKCNIENGAGYGLRPCYSDISDPSTLEFWIIYYKNS